MIRDAFVIPLSKGKVLAVAVAPATAFVMLGVFIYLHAQVLPHNPTLTKSVCIACILFFGLGSIYGWRKLFDTAPGLIIDSEGLIDNASAISAGRIPWSDFT